MIKTSLPPTINAKTIVTKARGRLKTISFFFFKKDPQRKKVVREDTTTSESPIISDKGASLILMKQMVMRRISEMITKTPQAIRRGKRRFFPCFEVKPNFEHPYL